MASFEFIGLDNVKAKLQNLLAAKQDALMAAGLALLTDAQKTITQGGSGWPSWSSAYAARVKKSGRAHQMLWDTGALVRSLTLGGANNIFVMEDNTITLGSNVKYARRQNVGGGGIPARPYLFIDDKRMNDARQAFIAQLARSLNN